MRVEDGGGVELKNLGVRGDLRSGRAALGRFTVGIALDVVPLMTEAGHVPWTGVVHMRLAELAHERIEEHRALGGHDEVVTAVAVPGELLNPLRGLGTAYVGTAVVLNLVDEDHSTFRQILPNLDVLNRNDAVLVRLETINWRAKLRSTVVLRVFEEIPQFVGSLAVARRTGNEFKHC